MKKTVTRISPWQSAKPLALTYFVLGIPIALLMGLTSLLFPVPPGEVEPSPWYFLAVPFMYGLVILIAVPITCWIYNKAATLVGGVELLVESRPDD